MYCDSRGKCEVKQGDFDNPYNVEVEGEKCEKMS